MAKGGGSVILIENDRWLGHGGESALHWQDGFILVFHAYDSQSGKPSLQVSTIAWKDGWPHLALAGGKPDKQ
jgi:arabinan endo-1,5-alpha-L-arabinosidase